MIKCFFGQRLPICSMYGIFTCNYHKFEPNVDKYSIHGSYGVGLNMKNNCQNTTAATFRSLSFLPWMVATRSSMQKDGKSEPSNSSPKWWVWIFMMFILWLVESVFKKKHQLNQLKNPSLRSPVKTCSLACLLLTPLNPQNSEVLSVKINI